MTYFKKATLVVIFLILNTFSLHAQTIFDAAKTGDIQQIRDLLKESTVSIDQRDDNGKAILHYAVLNDHKELVGYLIETGADIELPDWEWYTPLHFAADAGRTDIAQILIDNNANLFAKAYSGFTPAHLAVYENRKQMLELLLANNVSINIIGNNGTTLMHIAALGGKNESIDFLLSKGAIINIQDLFGRTPLHIAVSSGHLNCVELLIERGADVNAKSLNGSTPYNTAKNTGNDEIANLLLSKDADSKDRSFTLLQGDYFGQKPPGLEPELFVPGFISTGGMEFAGTFTPDGKEFLFTRNGGEMNLRTNTIMITRSIENTWTEPKIAAFSGKYFDFETHITPDGSRMLFGSQRPKPEGTKFGGDIWSIERSNNAWGEPRYLEAPINAGFSMYVTSAVNGTLYYTGMDGIYISEFNSGEYLEAEKLSDNINYVPAAHPYIAPDESFIIFDAQPNRPKNFKGYLYISFKKDDGTWTKAVKFDSRINKNEDVMCPSISPDGKYLFYCSQGSIYWVDAKIIDEHR